MAKAVRKIEVFRPGTFQPMVGEPVTLTAADLKAIGAAYDPALHPAPVVVGHPKTDDPAFGWAASFSFDENSQRLVSAVNDLAPEFEQAVADGRYKRISLSLFRPGDSNNPKPGVWYPKHIGFLGGAAPAVSGLKPVAFAGEDGVTIEFGEPRLRDVASLFRRLREYFIAEKGPETADALLPDWTIQWIADGANADDDDALFADPAKPTTTKEKPMSKPDDAAAFAAREAELAAREKKVKESEAKLRREEHVAFAEQLVAEGRLLPIAKGKTIELLEAVAGAQLDPVSFAEGSETVKDAAPIDVLKSLLKAQPKGVTFGMTELPKGDGAVGVSFAAPEGYSVDADGADLLARTRAYQAKHPDVAFADAYKAVGGR
ncbi:MAG: hypothetical protein KGL46_03985 [Hyphomicrobiales bacterium]|nr:hypothetical protein [Hyphomicrobiales bacterium]